LSLDPLASDYESFSDYSFVGNMPIVAVDPDGKSIEVVVKKNSDGSTLVNVTLKGSIINLSSNQSSALTAVAKAAIEADVHRVFELEHNVPNVGKVEFSVSIELDVVNSIEEIGNDDHVIAIVDDIPLSKTKDANGERVDPIANAASNGNVILAESRQVYGSKFGRIISHEIGHWFGLEDEYTKKGTDKQNLMHRFEGKELEIFQLNIMINQWSIIGGEFRNNNREELGTGSTREELNGQIDRSNAETNEN
jgi:hypothetical protein